MALVRKAALGLQSDFDRNAETSFEVMAQLGALGADRAWTSCSLMLKFTQIGSICTMVASLVGVLLAPTYSPTETRRAVTTPSNGAATWV